MKIFLKLPFIFIIISSRICFASSPDNSTWLSLGLGSTFKAFDDNHSGISIGMIGQYQFQKNILSLQLISNTELRSLAYNPRPNLSISHISILYSRLVKGKNSILAVGVGPGYVKFIERGDLIKDNWPSASEYEKLVHHHLGAIVNAQALIFGSIFGLGINYYVNLNPKQIFSGFLVCLHFGKF